MTTDLLPLQGIRCTRCGHVATPVQHFGCEKCGSHGDAVSSTTLSGDGVVLNAVTVHRPDDEPLRIGSVHLAEGPMLRALLGSDAAAGDAVRASDHDGVLVFEQTGGDR